jgi:NADH:ubiquinone oxidoreductase subunit E
MLTDTNTGDKKFEKLSEIISEKRDQQGMLLPILQEAQNIFGYLDEEIQLYISEKTGVPLTTIYGVSTFYSQFTLKPKGQYRIEVCLGTACYVKGAQAILDELEKVLKVNVGQTTKDGKFSLNAARCLGCCGLAPVMKINDEVFGAVKPSDIKNILKRY